MKNIKYIDTFAWGTAHEMFNASLLWMCANIKDAKVTCRATKSNYNMMVNLLANNDLEISNFNFKRVWTFPGTGKYALLLRYIWGTWLIWWYLIFSTNKKDFIVIPFNNMFAIKGINVLSRMFKRKVLVFCHGEMEFIASDVKKNGILSQCLCKLCRQFFLNIKLKISTTLYFAVIGDSVAKNLTALLPTNFKNKFFALDHPYIFNKVKINDRVQSKVLTVGTCGSINISKGILQLVKFSNLCHQRGLNINILHIGVVANCLEELLESGVTLPSVNSPLSREQYNKYISELDYFLYFYGSDNYKITASGAILDAIAAEKPIIALKNDYFQYIFNKFGEIGILCNSVEEMVDAIVKIQTGKLNFDIDFTSIKRKLTPKFLAADLQLIVDRI